MVLNPEFIKSYWFAVKRLRLSAEEIRCVFDDNSKIIIPPANCVCGRVYGFHVVRPNEQMNERKCVRDILFP